LSWNIEVIILIREKTEVLGEIPLPVLLGRTQISPGLDQDFSGERPGKKSLEALEGF
jgi:FKBP-type peptidyl-prolyl cis-trans isomerase 2